MHSLPYSLLNTNERLRKQLPSPRISHETISKITKPSAAVRESRISKQKPPLKIAIAKTNGYTHNNNLGSDHVTGDLVELIHTKVGDLECDKSNNVKLAQCCFATPKSATFFTVKSARAHALTSLTKPPLLRERTNFTPHSPTTTFELNSTNNSGLYTTDNSSSMTNPSAAANPFGAIAGYNFNFFEVTDIGTPVNAAHEYSLKLGELLASFNNKSTIHSASTGSPVSQTASSNFNKPEQLQLPVNSSGVAATCITPARTHFLFSKVSGNLSQSSHQTIFEEPEGSGSQAHGSGSSTLPTSPSSSPRLNGATEQPVGPHDPMVVIETDHDGSPQYHYHPAYHQHYQVELLSNYPEYFFPIIVPQQHALSSPPAKDFTHPPVSSLGANPAGYNVQTHANFFSPTFGWFPLQQQVSPEWGLSLPQADPQSISPAYAPASCESYYYQDHQPMVQPVPYNAGQSYTSQPSPPQYTSFSEVSVNESSYAPGSSSSSSSSMDGLSPCSSETSYEASLVSGNSPLSDEATSNDQYYEEKTEKKLKKKSRENKAWTNPTVMAGLHVSLMHKNSLRTEKALPGKKGKYFCSHCKGQFRTILDLCAHMDTVGVSRPFHCPDPDCPWYIAGFPTASEWCRHTRFQHGGEADRDAQKLACENCGKKFTRKDSLKRHYILVHDNKNSRYNSKLRKLEERRLKKKKRQQQQRQQRR